MDMLRMLMVREVKMADVEGPGRMRERDVKHRVCQHPAVGACQKGSAEWGGWCSTSDMLTMSQQPLK